MRLILSIFLLCAVVGVGCERKREDRGGQPIRRGDVAEAGEGVIRGMIRFEGTPPVMKPIDKKNACAHDETPIFEEWAVVGGNGGLANVLVYLQDAPIVGSPPPQAVVLDQVNCRYVPRTVGLRVGQTLRIKTSDPIPHNVHLRCSANRTDNFFLGGPPEFKDRVFDKPEVFHATCDVHPWMSAMIGVFEHPFFAVTAPDGAFELIGIPAGDYTLVARHERFGALSRKISVADGSPVVSDLVFSLPGGR